MIVLFRLFALNIIEKEPQEFYTSNSLTVAQVERAKETILELLAQVRPHAVPLIDSWNLPDWLLNSSLGRHDGKVYEDMFRQASELNPLNESVVGADSFEPLQRQIGSGTGTRSRL